MLENYAVLPCNGLDKCAGIISGELAKRLCEDTDNELICPVFYRVAETKYSKIISQHPLLVIDGCPTRCASKLALERNLKISKKISITEEAKSHSLRLKKDLTLLEKELAFIDGIIDELNKSGVSVAWASEESVITTKYDYEIFQHGKFIFRVPTDPEMYFNENDCWAYVIGNRARIGITDFVQQNLSDILYFTPPEVGDDVDQFGDIGEIESSKAVFVLISPFSGKVITVNLPLVQKPELINENPYELGWVAEIELSDSENDKELLIGYERYLEIMKRKVEALNGK